MQGLLCKFAACCFYTVESTCAVSHQEFMFLQMADEPRLGYITDQLKSLSVTASAPPQLQVGALCVAQYSLDNEWYRASVQRVISKDPVNPQYSVIFLDFGNSDRVGGKNVQQIDSALAAVPAQAHSCSLAYLKVKLSMSCCSMLHTWYLFFSAYCS